MLYSSPVSLYYQLKETFINNIIDKTWQPDSRIPSERELCDLYGVSRVTVRKALDELVQGGYIYRVQGKGTFVKQRSLEQKLSKFYSFSEEIKKRGMKEATTVIQFEATVGETRILEQLRLPPGSAVFKVKRLRTIDDVPYAVETSYLPTVMMPELTKDKISKNGLYNTLRESGVFPVRATETFRAVTLRRTTAAFLEAKMGDAAIYLTRKTYVSNDREVEFCESIVLGSMFSYTIELS